MKYLFQGELGWQFGPYFDHLHAIRSRISRRLFELVADEDRYRLDSPKSLHDAWVVSINPLGPQESELEDAIEIHMSLLGPFHDRSFEIKYKAVKSYKFELAEFRSGQSKIDYLGETKYKDDLLIHEFDVLEDGAIDHRLLFESGQKIFISCTDLEFEEKMHP